MYVFPIKRVLFVPKLTQVPTHPQLPLLIKPLRPPHIRCVTGVGMLLLFSYSPRFFINFFSSIGSAITTSAVATILTCRTRSFNATIVTVNSVLAILEIVFLPNAQKLVGNIVNFLSNSTQS
ncbi:hypothetical protein C8Q75DRAFT_32912 [Abortiporus biennis]|nr:hypothetical protein C8Q75DRAFT_32912 [Abortiporus biennis]